MATRLDDTGAGQRHYDVADLMPIAGEWRKGRSSRHLNLAPIIRFNIIYIMRN